MRYQRDERAELRTLCEAIEQRAAAMTQPDQSFRFAVLVELEQARDRAITLAVLAGARIQGRCRACGCDHDATTPGCDNCHARHSMRRHSDRKAAGETGPPIPRRRRDRAPELDAA